LRLKTFTVLTGNYPWRGRASCRDQVAWRASEYFHIVTISLLARFLQLMSVDSLEKPPM
jgi:hypothetical protein